MTGRSQPLCCMTYGTTYAAYNSGYHPGYGALSAGIVLFADRIRSGHRPRLRCVRLSARQRSLQVSLRRQRPPAVAIPGAERLPAAGVVRMRSGAAPALPPQRVAMISVHSCPLATLGGRETGGMNVYVRELSRHLSNLGIAVDVYTRRQDPCYPTVVEFADQARVIHLPAGPAAPYSKHRVWDHLPQFVEGVQEFICEHALQYHIIHSHYWLSGWVAMQLLSQPRSPHRAHVSYPGLPERMLQPRLAWEQEPSRRLRVERTVAPGQRRLGGGEPGPASSTWRGTMTSIRPAWR